MRIGVLGSGTVGQTLAKGFLKHGHEAMLGTRDPEKPDVRKWLGETPGAQTGTFAQAATFGELVVLATKGTAAESALEMAGAGNLAGKTILDATNPIADKPPVDGILQFTTGPNESLAEKLQEKFPRSHFVKAYNSVGAGNMVNPHYEQGTPTMFFCGNDAKAKEQVADIIRMFGWEPFDCGGIIAARAIEPLCILWCLRGFQHNQWSHAFKLLTK
ncbi:MAG TPA: NAD(P)-binding domain-containing protein [Verrucomicrobiae bacterium]|nr:NAD(P)-binding domain-containing protein [Verrucomicrobiae bacterium]